jgi:hypothetical protein
MDKTVCCRGNPTPQEQLKKRQDAGSEKRPSLLLILHDDDP